MALLINRLTPRKVETATKPGMYPDGNGLYLQVARSGAKSWILRFRASGKRHDMGLGSYLNVSLAKARDKAKAAREKRDEGLNPLEARRQEAGKASSMVTFRDAATKYVATHEKGWKNEKHRSQWRQTLQNIAFPVIGDLSVASVDTAHVMRILEPIWQEKNETADRLRGRIERILDWARVRGFREGENPARWKGHLEHQLPEKSAIQKREHHPALPYAELPAFMALLRQKKGISPLALQFQILNANRSGEVLGARWEEFDLDEALWTIPAKRMKGKKGEERPPHRVPLSPAAIEILTAMKAFSEGEHVFPGRRGKELSDTALSTPIKRMHKAELKQGRKGFLDPKLNRIAVPHGFRSTFKDWCMETAPVNGDIDLLSEFALAHKLKDQIKAAYFRTGLLDQRRPLMKKWADFALSA